MANVLIMVHATWSTKERARVLEEKSRKILFSHILQYASDKGIIIDTIGGYIDHVHCLISLRKMTDISQIMNLIKGESAYWANKEQLFSEKLKWNEGYSAYSVSPWDIPKIRSYIANQEKKHSAKEDNDEWMDGYWTRFEVL